MRGVPLPMHRPGRPRVAQVFNLCSSPVGNRCHTAYVLLETVIATGLLILGLAVIGAQVQDSYLASKKMDLQVRAQMLAESKLAELDTGLLEFDSVDEEMEEEFGPLFPYYGFRIRIDPTATEELYLLTLEILYLIRNYEQDEFDFDEAEVLHTLYTFRMVPRPLDLAVDFGMDEEQVEELELAAADVGIELDVLDFSPRLLAELDVEEMIQFLPAFLEAFGMTLGDLQGLPPEVQEALKALTGEESDDEGDDFDEDDGGF